MKKFILSLAFALTTLFAVFAANPESDFDHVFLDNHEKGWLSQVEPSVDKSKDYLKITNT